MNSILAAAIGGGVGGALGGLIGGLLARLAPHSWRTGVRTAVTVASMVVGWQLAVAYLTVDENSPAAIEAGLLEHSDVGPLARAWRDADPVAYAGFAQSLSEAMESGEPRDQIVGRVRAQLIAAAVPRMMYLSDAQWVEITRTASLQYQQLGAAQPSICSPMFYGEPFGDITQYVGADTLRREMELLEAAFRTDTSAMPTIATGDVFTALLTRVLDSTRARVGDDVLLITRERSAEGRELAFCNAVSVFHEEIARLPETEAAALMRGLRAPAA